MNVSQIDSMNHDQVRTMPGQDGDAHPWAFQPSEPTQSISLDDLDALPEEFWQQQAATVPLPDPDPTEALQFPETFRYGAPVSLPKATEGGLGAASYQPQSYHQSGIVEHCQTPFTSSGYPELNDCSFDGQSQIMSTLPPHGQIPGLGGDFDSNMCLVTNMSNVGYYGSVDTSNANRAPMSNSDWGSFNQGIFLHDSRPPLQSTQLAFGPLTFNDHSQHQHSHANTSDGAYLPAPQQSDLQQTPLRLPFYDLPVADLRAFNGPTEAKDLGALAYADYTPTPLVQNGGLFPHSDANVAPISSVNKSGHGIMPASMVSVVPANLNPFRYDISTTTSKTPGYDATQVSITTDSSRTHHNTVAGTSRKRALSPAYVASQELSVSHGMSNRNLGPAINLDNREEYDPLPDRRVKRQQKRTRIVREKAAWACLACWMLKGKCSRSGKDPCDRCMGILKRWPNMSVSKFACDVRTPLVDITPLLNAISRKIETPTLNPSKRYLLDVPEPIRNILDVIEPQHIRQLWPKDTGMLLQLSYGFSIARWRDAVLLLEPSLELDINALEISHRAYLEHILAVFDHNALYRDENRSAAAGLFTELYEGVCSLRPRSAEDESSISHFRSTLEHRISLLYSVIFPMPRSQNQRKELQKLAIYLGTYPRTRLRLPREYHDHGLGLPDSFMLQAQNSSWHVVESSSYRTFPQISGSSTSRFPALLKYVPARFLSVFGLDADVSSCGPQEIADNVFRTLKRLEELLVAVPLFNTPAHVLILELSPHALAFTMKAFFDVLATTKMTTIRPPSRLSCAWYIIPTSVAVCERFLKEGLPPKEEIDTWLHTWHHVSSAMYSWLEQNEYAKTVEQEIACFLLDPNRLP